MNHHKKVANEICGGELRGNNNNNSRNGIENLVKKLQQCSSVLGSGLVGR